MDTSDDRDLFGQSIPGPKSKTRPSSMSTNPAICPQCSRKTTPASDNRNRPESTEDLLWVLSENVAWFSVWQNLGHKTQQEIRQAIADAMGE